jgi:thioredoxin reductase
VNSGTEVLGTGSRLRERPAGSKPDSTEVAVIGAGPYGLSAGVHLKAKGIKVRIFGEPMAFWAKQMPEGMLLRSPRVASTISNPGHKLNLEDYESAEKIQPKAPLPLDTFVEYGQWLSKKLGSDLDTRTVARVDREPQGFRLTLADGETVRAEKVVVATGIGPFRKKPAVFKDLPLEYVSHCYEGRDVQKFRGKKVAVIGAGQSALESAALIHEAGAKVELLVRNPDVKWIGGAPWLHKLGPISLMLYSSHDVGPAGISRMVAYPNLMRFVPLPLRDKIRKRAVRSAGSRWLPERLKTVKLTTSRYVTQASVVGGGLVLKLDDGSERRVDHIVLGTGYEVDISRYDFLPAELVREVKQFDGYPILTSGFRCSVPGLHFIGATAARSFGPLLYFVAGTEFASHELVSHIAQRKETLR